MDKIILTIALTAFSLRATSGQDTCYFDFEDQSELENFDKDCNGILNNKWNIINSPTDPPPPLGFGQHVLDNQPDLWGCMISYKEISVSNNPRISVDYYLKQVNTQGYASLTITLLCASEESVWDVPLESGEDFEGKWINDEFTFEVDANSCKVKVNEFRNNNFLLYIDRIVLLDVEDTDCYAVPKPDPSTTEIDPTTKTDQTTTETDPTTTETDPTTKADQTTTETDPTTKADQTTTETDPTTKADQTTTETDPTTKADQTTTETDPTTINDQTTEIDPTTKTDQTTTETDPTTKADQTTTETDPTTKIDQTTTETDATSKTEQTTTEKQPTETTTTKPPALDNSTSTIPPRTTLGPEADGNSGISILYMVTIIATAGGISLLALAVCYLTIIWSPRIRKIRKKTHVRAGLFMPPKISVN